MSDDQTDGAHGREGMHVGPWPPAAAAAAGLTEEQARELRWDLEQAAHEKWDRRPFDVATIQALAAVAAHHRAEGERHRINSDLQLALRGLRTLVRDDGWAITWQTMGQYRMALIRAFDKELALLTEPPGGGPTHE